MRWTARQLSRSRRREGNCAIVLGLRDSPPASKSMFDNPPAIARERMPAITRALTDAALLDRARDALERRLAADPRDEGALLGLGDLARREGKFAQAIAAYRALHEIRGDAASAWAIGAIGGEERLGAPPEGYGAAPFVRRTNFLGAAEQRKLRVALGVGPEEFNPAKVTGRKLERPEYRSALVAKRRTLREVRPWFMPRLRAVLPDVATQLGVPRCNDGRVEIALTATLAGGFYRVHRDDSNDLANPDSTRAISYVYYCHREPKPFAGGELLLYDTCPATKRFRKETFSRIDPMHNMLVLFPSCYYHEILPVRGGDRFEDARFTVNGWVHGPRE